MAVPPVIASDFTGLLLLYHLPVACFVLFAGIMLWVFQGSRPWLHRSTFIAAILTTLGTFAWEYSLNTDLHNRLSPGGLLFYLSPALVSLILLGISLGKSPGRPSRP